MRHGFIQLIFGCLAAMVMLALAACQSVVGVYHTVRQGETLYSISKAYSVPVDTLQRVNFMRDPSLLITGEKLFIPGASEQLDGHPAKPAAENPSGDIQNGGKRALVMTGRNFGERVDNNLGFIWPTDGVLTSAFGDRSGRQHNGIDISAPHGSPIVAAADGRVIYAATDQRGYGHIILIEHAEGFITVYAHNDENLAKEGDVVKRGDLIARVGRTGNAQGYHVHFEIRLRREAVDPLKYLP